MVEAARKQNELLQHSTTIYLNPNVGAYAEMLASKMPGDLKFCYFVNSGSEANDLAILMAPGSHRQLRHHRVAQRLSRPQLQRHGIDRAQHLKV